MAPPSTLLSPRSLLVFVVFGESGEPVLHSKYTRPVSLHSAHEDRRVVFNFRPSIILLRHCEKNRQRICSEAQVT